MEDHNSQYKEYEHRASNVHCDTQIAGRYSFQKEDERRIIPDLFKKLDIRSSDSLLEIGCGTGNLLVPLSFCVDRAVGIDNQAAIKKLLNKDSTGSVEGVVGNFLTYDASHLGKFKKILIYGVLHCLANEKEVYHFVDKALALLDQGGMLVIGDIPNTSLKDSFIKSETGKEFSKQWQRRMESDATKDFESSVTPYIFDDENIFNMMGHIKKQGYKAYLLPQSPDLPFGHTREDIVVSGF
jgi:cyclopropane fatty-acyl-phospholipid synthase-like methyltransferase